MMPLRGKLLRNFVDETGWSTYAQIGISNARVATSVWVDGYLVVAEVSHDPGWATPKFITTSDDIELEMPQPDVIRQRAYSQPQRTLWQPPPLTGMIDVRVRDPIPQLASPKNAEYRVTISAKTPRTFFAMYKDQVSSPPSITVRITEEVI